MLMHRWSLRAHAQKDNLTSTHSTAVGGTCARRTFLAGSIAVAAGLTPISCGYLLYPERKGRSGGRIDVPILIVDLIWLLPGIVPGVICLAVDFSTGCIYAAGDVAIEGLERIHDPGRWSRLALKATVHVDGEVVALASSAESRARPSMLQLEWNRDVSAAELVRSGRLRLVDASGVAAETSIDRLS